MFTHFIGPEGKGKDGKGFTIAQCRDECKAFEFFVIQKKDMCACGTTENGVPAKNYPALPNLRCNAFDLGLGAWNVNAVYRNLNVEKENVDNSPGPTTCD